MQVGKLVEPVLLSTTASVTFKSTLNWSHTLSAHAAADNLPQPQNTSQTHQSVPAQVAHLLLYRDRFSSTGDALAMLQRSAREPWDPWTETPSTTTSLATTTTSLPTRIPSNYTEAPKSTSAPSASAASGAASVLHATFEHTAADNLPQPPNKSQTNQSVPAQEAHLLLHRDQLSNAGDALTMLQRSAQEPWDPWTEIPSTTTSLATTTTSLPTRTPSNYTEAPKSTSAPATSGAAGVVHATFAAVALLSALNFTRRGITFTMVSDPIEHKRRTPILHLMIAVASLVLSVANALEFQMIPTPFPLPWCYSARAISTALLVCVIGFVCNAKDIGIAIVLAMAAWAQMCAATGAPKVSVQWGLFLLGMMTGSAALWKVNGMVEEAVRSDLELNMEGSLRPTLDLGTMCSAVHVVMWLLTEGAHVVWQTLDVAINCVFDVLLIGGCGHLLLKRENLLLAYSNRDCGD